MNAISPRREFDDAMRIAHVMFTIEQTRNIAVQALMRQNGSGRTLHEIDKIKDEAVYNSLSLVGTVLAPIITALHARGVHLDYTLGDLQKALDFTNDEMHYVVCSCDHGSFTEYRMAAQRIAFVPHFRVIATGLFRDLRNDSL